MAMVNPLFVVDLAIQAFIYRRSCYGKPWSIWSTEIAMVVSALKTLADKNPYMTNGCSGTPPSVSGSLWLEKGV